MRTKKAIRYNQCKESGNIGLSLCLILFTVGLSFAGLLLSCNNSSPKKAPLTVTLELSDEITKDTIQTYLLLADSILLISHLELDNSPPDPQTGKLPPGSALVEDGKISPALFLKSKRLSSTEIAQLGNILDENVVDDIEYTKCFSPRNAIVVYKNTSIAYLDICFECLGVYYKGFPENIKMSVEKYNKLNSFFMLHKVE